MTTGTEKSLPARVLPDIFALGFCLGLAFFKQWEASDLIWSLWLSSLVLGYLTFFSAFAGGVYYVFRQSEYPENRKISDILIAIGIGFFLLAFFSFHFGAFHAGHASFLSSFFPIEGMPDKFGQAFMNPFMLWDLAFRHLVTPYGLFLVSMIIAERQHVFRHLIKGIRAAHATSTADPAEGRKKEPDNDENPLGEIVLRPYINVIRMHLLIFFFAFSSAMEVDGLIVFAVVGIIYFFPWHEFKHDKTALLIIALSLAVILMAAMIADLLRKESGAPAPSRAQAFEVREIARDDRFIAYSNGTVIDTRTSLMWAATDNGTAVDWRKAKRYCRNYRGGGYTDWRMPTQGELAGLYDKSRSYKATRLNYDVHLTKLIELSTPTIWAAETRGSQAALFFFIDGVGFWDDKSSAGDYRRVLPVRFDKREGHS